MRINRVPKGVPTGGQFSEGRRGESAAATLADDSAPAPKGMHAELAGETDGIEWACCRNPYGDLNGYARIPDGHPWHNLDYDTVGARLPQVKELTYGRDGWVGFDSHGAAMSDEGVEDEARRLAEGIRAAAPRRLPAEKFTLPGFVHPGVVQTLHDLADEHATTGALSDQSVDFAQHYWLPTLSRDQIRDRAALMAESDDYEQRSVMARGIGLEDAENRGIPPMDPPEARFDPTFEPVYQTGYQGLLNDYKDTAEVAKDVRGEIKAAKESGYLPPDLEYSVRIDRFSGGSAIRIEVRGLDDDQIEEPYYDEGMGRQLNRSTPEAAELKRRLQVYLDERNRDESDSMTDFFSTDFYGSVVFEHEWARDLRKEKSEKARARRASKR